MRSIAPLRPEGCSVGCMTELFSHLPVHPPAPSASWDGLTAAILTENGQAHSANDVAFRVICNKSFLFFFSPLETKTLELPTAPRTT